MMQSPAFPPEAHESECFVSWLIGGGSRFRISLLLDVCSVYFDPIPEELVESSDIIRFRSCLEQSLLQELVYKT